MSTAEIKNKTLKLAQAYRTERLKNLEFEESIKLAYKDIDTIPDFEKELESI